MSNDQVRVPMCLGPPSFQQLALGLGHSMGPRAALTASAMSAWSSGAVVDRRDATTAPDDQADSADAVSAARGRIE